MGALALRRDARKLFATLGALLPSEESLGAGDVFRATLRPELEAATAALATATGGTKAIADGASTAVGGASVAAAAAAAGASAAGGSASTSLMGALTSAVGACASAGQAAAAALLGDDRGAFEETAQAWTAEHAR